MTFLELVARIWPVVFLVIPGGTVFLVVWAYLAVPWGAPWVPAPSRTVRRMLRLAGVQPGEKVVDLGAGDGRIVALAAREFGAHAVGVEIDPLRCLLANTWILLQGLRHRAHVYHGSMYDFDLRDADVVTLHLLQTTNQRLQDRLSAQLRPGARVVSHTFSFDGWFPLAIDDEKHLFFYEMGNTGPEVQTRFV
jgi:SAM-dependent methyltransferase